MLQVASKKGIGELFTSTKDKDSKQHNVAGMKKVFKVFNLIDSNTAGVVEYSHLYGNITDENCGGS